MWRLIGVSVCALLASTISLGQSCQSSDEASSNAKTDKVMVETLLFRLGKANAKFFTFEEATVEGVARHLRGYRIEPPPLGADFSAALHYLTQTVPDFTYEVDSLNPDIVHIIDSRLARHEGYALDQVTDLTFDGSVTDLVGALHAKGITISAGGAFDAHEFMFIDRGTQVHVVAKGLSARSILSDFLMLQGRGTILWNAETNVGSNQVSYLRYQGAPRSH